MPVTKKNILRHELIGLEAQVVSSSDPNLLGTYGKILDETKDMLVIEHMTAAKIVPKSGSTFEIKLPDGQTVVVEGNKLVGRPEERVRRKR
ncbi:MAG: ribonuclease P protein component 1 [Hadesarchaea archaeon]|nr:ribonuclease P protein component 1 [Hadesarchaea archaeon]